MSPTATEAATGSLPPALAELLQGLVGEAGGGHEVREEWSSRTARFARIAGGDRPGDELVIKVCDRWTPSHARDSARNADRIAALDDAGGRWRTLRFVAWSPDPPAVVSWAVDGEELKTLFRHATRADLGRLRLLVEAAGELLGRIHAAFPAEVSGDGGRRVLCAGDFGIYNFRVEAGDRLVYMEPPDRELTVPRTRDVACFLWSIHSWTPPDLRRAAKLRASFLAGYRRGAGAGPAWRRRDDLRVERTLLLRRWRSFRRRRDAARGAR
jgi:hypothetical protein